MRFKSIFPILKESLELLELEHLERKDLRYYNKMRNLLQRLLKTKKDNQVLVNNLVIMAIMLKLIN